MSRVGVGQRYLIEPFDVLPTLWTANVGSGTESIISVGGNNRVYQVAGYRWRTYPHNIKLEPTWLYRISVRVRSLGITDATNDRFYLGCQGFAADGVTVVDIAGGTSYLNSHYFGVFAADASTWPVGEWRQFTGYFRGWSAVGNSRMGQSPDINNPGGFHPNVRFFRPLFGCNYDGGPSSNIIQVDNLEVEVVAVPNVDFVHLIELEYSGGTLSLHTGAQDLLWNGLSWFAVGGQLAFSGVEESSDAGGVDVVLSGVNQTVLAALLNNNYRGRRVRIYRAYLDPVSGGVRADPVMLFEGLQLSPYEITEDRNHGGGTVTVKSRMRSRLGIGKVRGIAANLTSHQHLFAGDTFFQFAASIGGQQIHWGGGNPTRVRPDNDDLNYDNPEKDWTSDW